MRNKILFLILGIFLVGFVSSATLSLSTNPLSLNMNLGSTSQIIVSYSINNTNGFAGQYGINLFGTPKLVSYSGSPISYAENTTTNGTITINVNGNVSGSFVNYIGIGGETINIPIQVSQPTECRLNPSLIFYTQTVQQGTEFELPKIIFNPTNCQGDFLINSAYITGGVTTTEGQKPVYIKSASLTDVLLGVNTKGLSSITYPTKLTVVAFGRTFSDVSTVTIIVTGGTNPQGNFSVDSLPTCSITNTILNLNSTYSLVCTNLQPDISIKPIIDNEYIQGLGADISQNQYTWYFKPKKMGNSFIRADFYYSEDSPVGDSYTQEVKIQSSTSAFPGTELIAQFFQEGSERNRFNLNPGVVVILALDNKTRNTISPFNLIVNGQSRNTTELNLSLGEIYNLRITASGYNDFILENLTATESRPQITLEPQKDSYFVGDLVNVTSNIEGVVFTLNDVIIESPYSFSSSGDFVLKAEKNGYLPSYKNISVLNLISLTSINIPYESWKKGDGIKLSLEKSSAWSVDLYTELKDGIINSTYQTISSGIGSEVSFNLTDYGQYNVNVDGKFANSYSLIKNESAFLSLFKKYWYLFVGGFVLVSFFIVVLVVKGSSSSSAGVPFGVQGGNVKYG